MKSLEIGKPSDAIYYQVILSLVVHDLISQFRWECQLSRDYEPSLYKEMPVDLDKCCLNL